MKYIGVFIEGVVVVLFVVIAALLTYFFYIPVRIGQGRPICNSFDWIEAVLKRRKS